jgi:hypothetical protein
MEISLIASGIFAGGVRDAARQPWIMPRLGGRRARIPYRGEYCRPKKITVHARDSPVCSLRFAKREITRLA